jgi:hypothetical protein
MSTPHSGSARSGIPSSLPKRATDTRASFAAAGWGGGPQSIDFNSPRSIAPKGIRKSPVPRKVMAKFGVPQKHHTAGDLPVPSKSTNGLDPPEEKYPISPEVLARRPIPHGPPKISGVSVRIIYRSLHPPQKETRPGVGAINVVWPGPSVRFSPRNASWGASVCIVVSWNGRACYWAMHDKCMFSPLLWQWFSQFPCQEA